MRSKTKCYVDVFPEDLEEAAVGHLESVPLWSSKLEDDIKELPSETKGVMKIYLKESIESIKRLRTTNISPGEKFDPVNKLVSKISFWKGILLRIDFGKHQSVKDKAFEELVRAETQLIHLRDIVKEEMGR